MRRLTRTIRRLNDVDTGATLVFVAVILVAFDPVSIPSNPRRFQDSTSCVYQIKLFCFWR